MAVFLFLGMKAILKGLSEKDVLSINCKHWMINLRNVNEKEERFADLAFPSSINYIYLTNGVGVIFNKSMSPLFVSWNKIWNLP